MVVYLGRVGSLSRQPKAKVYNFELHGDRREAHIDENSTVVGLNNRSNTLC